MVPLAQQTVTNIPVLYAPVAVGFFGLATGYFIWGGQALFDYPKDNPDLNRTIAVWGFWLPGFMQFLTGVYLMIGLTWFTVFQRDPPLYMAALAFTAYGIHWFALAYRRYIGATSELEAWMAIPFLLLSILGAIVFALANAPPVAVLFVGLSLIYATEVPTRFGALKGERLIGLWQVLTGIWLIYLTYGTVLNISLHRHWWA